MKQQHVMATHARAPFHGSIPEEAVAPPRRSETRRRSVAVLARAPANGRLEVDARQSYALWPRGRRVATSEAPLRAATTKLIAAILSAAISLGLLGAVAGSFRNQGAPFERVAAVERACADRVYGSERDACVRAALALCTALRRDLPSRQC